MYCLVIMHRSTSQDNILVMRCVAVLYIRAIPILEIMHVMVNPRPPYLDFVYT